MEKKLQKYIFNYNLLIVQTLRQTHHQIWSIIFLKEFIELNVNSNMMIKNVKLLELNKCAVDSRFREAALNFPCF